MMEIIIKLTKDYHQEGMKDSEIKKVVENKLRRLLNLNKIDKVKVIIK